MRKREGIRGRRGGAYAIPDKQPVIPGIPEGPNMQAEEIRWQFKAGQAANSQVSHYKTRGHLKTLRIFSLPFLFLFPENSPCLATPPLLRLP